MKVGGYQLWPVQTGGVILKKGAGLGIGQSGLLFTQEGAALSTVVNTVTTTQFTTPFTPPVINANVLGVKGAWLTINLWGVFRTTGALQTVNLGVGFDDATAPPWIGIATVTCPNTLQTGWSWSGGLVIRTAGAGGLYGTMPGVWTFADAGIGNPATVVGGTTASGAALDTTVAHTIQAAITWGAADPNNTITLQGCTVSLAYPIVAA